MRRLLYLTSGAALFALSHVTTAVCIYLNISLCLHVPTCYYSDCDEGEMQTC
jgi:hypothetical protein